MSAFEPTVNIVYRIVSYTLVLLQCIAMNAYLYVRPCVCSRFIISPNLFPVLIVAVTQSSSVGVVIRYVLPVLWMTSCFPIMGFMATLPLLQQRR